LLKRFVVRPLPARRLEDFELLVARCPTLDDLFTAEHLIKTLQLHRMYSDEIDKVIKKSGYWDCTLS
jgi:hypothetical protein